MDLEQNYMMSIIFLKSVSRGLNLGHCIHIALHILIFLRYIVLHIILNMYGQLTSLTYPYIRPKGILMSEDLTKK